MNNTSIKYIGFDNSGALAVYSDEPIPLAVTVAVEDIYCLWQCPAFGHRLEIRTSREGLQVDERDFHRLISDLGFHFNPAVGDYFPPSAKCLPVNADGYDFMGAH